MNTNTNVEGSQRYDQIIALIRRATSVPGAAAREIQEDLMSIFSAFKTGDDILLDQILQLVEEKICQIQANLNAATEVDGFESDELTLKIIAVLLSAGLDVTALHQGNQSDLLTASARSPVKPIECAGSGLIYGTIVRRCVVILPELDDHALQGKVISDLLEVWDAGRSCKGWIVDCSNIKKLPVFLMATLLGYKMTLSEQGQDFRIVWVPRDAVHETFLRGFEKSFDLELIGDFYFTSRRAK